MLNEITFLYKAYICCNFQNTHSVTDIYNFRPSSEGTYTICVLITYIYILIFTVCKQYPFELYLMYGHATCLICIKWININVWFFYSNGEVRFFQKDFYVLCKQVEVVSAKFVWCFLPFQLGGCIFVKLSPAVCILCDTESLIYGFRYHWA